MKMNISIDKYNENLIFLYKLSKDILCDFWTPSRNSCNLEKVVLSYSGKDFFLFCA